MDSSNNKRNDSCYQIIEQCDEEEEKDNVLIKGRRHKKPAKNKKSGGLYEGKQVKNKKVSLMDIQMKDELEDFNKLELKSVASSENQDKMDVDRISSNKEKPISVRS